MINSSSAYQQVASEISIAKGGLPVTLQGLDTEAYNQDVIKDIQSQFGFNPNDIEAVVNAKPGN